MRKVCVVTGTRADYGQLRWVMEAIQQSDLLDLQLLVTGTHLSYEFGLTYREIEADSFRIDKKVEMLLSSDSSVAITKSMGLGLIGFADALSELDPDLLLVLGDRYEILAVASAALIARVPIAHLHGGETTEGVIDDCIRHAVTKMSHLHFVAADEYRQRVIQLGEQPERVFQVGGMGVDTIVRSKLLSREELERSLGFKFGQRNLLVTFHPPTLHEGEATRQLAELLAALEHLDDTHLIFTMPNADPEGRALSRDLEAFALRHPETSRIFASLGQVRYLSTVAFVDGVVGNSSSGLTEVPSFRKGTINIGDRQEGRLKAESVIDVPPERFAIASAIEQLYSPEFQGVLAEVRNPYGEGGATEKIVEILERVELSGLLKKRFFPAC